MEKWNLAVHGADLMRKRTARLRELTALPGQFRQATVARLRALVEPRINAMPGGALPFTSLTAQETNLFALIVPAELAMRIDNNVAHAVPDYILHFDDVLLGGGPKADSTGATKFEIGYYMRDPGGRLHFTTGFFDISYSVSTPK